MAKGLLIKKENNKLSLEIVHFDSLESIYKLLECEYIDHFNIDSPYKRIECYCDDLGMNNRTVTLYSNNQNIHGPILCFGGASLEGDELDITIQQMGFITAHLDRVNQVLNFKME